MPAPPLPRGYASLPTYPLPSSEWVAPFSNTSGGAAIAFLSSAVNINGTALTALADIDGYQISGRAFPHSSLNHFRHELPDQPPVLESHA